MRAAGSRLQKYFHGSILLAASFSRQTKAAGANSSSFREAAQEADAEDFQECLLAKRQYRTLHSSRNTGHGHTRLEARQLAKPPRSRPLRQYWKAATVARKASADNICALCVCQERGYMSHIPIRTCDLRLLHARSVNIVPHRIFQFSVSPYNKIAVWIFIA